MELKVFAPNYNFGAIKYWTHGFRRIRKEFSPPLPPATPVLHYSMAMA